MIEKEVEDLLSKGAITSVNQKKGQFLSTLWEKMGTKEHKEI